MSFPKNNIIDNWLEENGDPEIEKLTERNLAISNKVQAILNQRGIKQKEFATILNKKPSEVSKWLSGLHNLTLKNITKMQVALGERLANTNFKGVILPVSRTKMLDTKRNGE